jgi:plasmid maintenance system antidote protein VapI/DNA-binding MarR family transcriptional regulator
VEEKMQKDSFVEILRAEFEKKCDRNKQYSLRSFSRDLEIDASNLSKILSYQKPLGAMLKVRLAKSLGFAESEIETLSKGLFSKTSDVDYESHELDAFQIVSQWQHYAILELFKLENFQPTPAQIQKHLGIDKKLAEESLKRLKEVGMIKQNKTTKVLELTSDSSSSILSQATSKAHRNQQQEILEGAIDALNKVPIEWRSQTSMTMAVDIEKLDEARELIKEFRRKMGRLLGSGKKLNEVYQLSVSLYPLTHPYQD